MSEFNTTRYEPLTSLASEGELERWLACASGPDGRRQLVVIERIPRTVSDDGALLRAAYQETQRAASLNHRALVGARDLFEREDGYYVVLDFAAGETVEFLWASFAARGEPAPLALTARVIAEAAAGLDFARRKTSSAGEPLIHGHLSPKSLILGYDGKTKIFGHGTAAIHRGVAKARGGLGTSNLHYCAPEQFKGGEADARTDMFALGVILWELLTGRRLYQRSGPYEVMRAVCDESVPKPSQVESSVPTRLDPILQRVLAKNPSRRYADYGEFLMALEGLLQLPGVADRSMRLGELLAEQFPDRASRWRQVDEAEQTHDFKRASYLVRELEVETGRVASPTFSDGDDTITETVASYTTQPRQASPIGAGPSEATSQFGRRSDSLDQADPEDTLLSEIPDDIWQEVASTHEMEPRRTELGRGAAQHDSDTAEMDSPVSDPTRPVAGSARRAVARRGTQLGKPAGVSVPSDAETTSVRGTSSDAETASVRQPFSDAETASVRQSRSEDRASFDASQRTDGVSPSANQPQRTDGVSPSERSPRTDGVSPSEKPPRTDGVSPSESKPSRPKTTGPVHISANLGAGFDNLDWSEAFAQFDEDDDQDDEFEPAFAIDEILAPPSARLPSRDERASHSIMEIVRHDGSRALDVETLEGIKRRYREKEAPFSAKLGLKDGTITLDEPLNGWVLRRNDGDNRRALPAPGEKLALKPGDQCEIRRGDVSWRVRVLRPPLPPMRNRPQITKQSLVIYALALLLAGAAHGGGLLGVMAVQALGVRMTVSEKPKQEEIFAEGKIDDLKRPEKPEEPKPEPKPPTPTRPTPKPVDPTEQKVKIPKTIKKELANRVKEKVASRSSSSASETQNTLEMLKSPNPGSGSSVKEVVSNIDAVKKPGGSGGFKVGGTIASLEGDDVNMALGGGGKLGKLGGKSIGKDVGKLDGRKKTGKVRGKVTGIRALSKVQGSLSRSDVYKVIDRHAGQLQGCYERRLLANPSLAGKLVYTWTVKTNGRVKSVRERSSTLGDAKVSKCVAGVIKKMKFPKPKGGEVEISYPFMFQQR